MIINILTFVEGPFWYFSLLVFVIGIAYHFVLRLSIPKSSDISTPREYGAIDVVKNFLFRNNKNNSSKFPLVITSYIFHLSLLLVVVFFSSHIVFIEKQIGVSWSAVPDWVFIIATQFCFASLLILLLRRVLDPVTNLLSTKGDFITNVLLFLVMFTGCMALFESFIVLKAIHMLFVDLLLIYFPFSKLMHAFFIFDSRYKTAKLYAKKGVRL